ncbi:hypothetical protein [Exiguobacterium aurantiacum]|uniref:hypothetical protein n=1 Tax=Exiguobacterium aurantiacum TaxID=33987 RepID=UPI001C27D4D9|nr:hypothetical protein [Exiguobacterium aurantiacum]
MRFKWANAAREDFLERFEMYDIQSVSPDSEAVILSVYGPTQVGKTTLILNLLGVKEEAINELSTFLRGKRNLGESATVTVTRYQISKTEEYVLTLPDEAPTVIHTSTVLEEKLAELRQRVEQGQHNAIAPVLIELPKSKFVQTNVTLELLDLPGIESAEERERRHVERCIDYWIPRSHVCLIVNSASDLTFLRDIGMSHLKHWYDYPDNFYVVLTRAFSPDSVKKRLQNKNIGDVENLRNYYKREMNDILGRITETIYPIEIGHSLERLQPFEQELAKKILNELKEQIQNINYQHVSFSYLTRYYAEVLRESEEDITFLNKKLTLKKSQTEQWKIRLGILIDGDEEKRIAHEEHLEIIKEVQDKFRIFFTYLWKRKTWEQQVDKLVDELQSCMSKKSLNNGFRELKISFEEQINSQILNMNKLLEKLYKEDDLLNLNVKLNVNVCIDFNNWDESKIDRYLSRRNYNDQIKLMKANLVGVTMNFCKSVYKEADEIYRSLTNLYDDLIRLHALEQRRGNRRKRTYEQRIRKIEYEISEFEIELLKTQSSWQKDQHHARTYKYYFIERFKSRKEELCKQAVYGDAKERYMAGIYLLMLEKDFEKIIETLG